MARMKEKYTAEVAPALMKQFGYKSVMQIPKIDKVVINVGCGEARENAKILENVVGDLTCTCCIAKSTKFLKDDSVLK